LICLILLITSVQISQGNDSVVVKKKTYKRFFNKYPLQRSNGRYTTSILPLLSYDPSSGIEVGVIPVFSIAPSDSLSKTFYRSSNIVSTFIYSSKRWINVKVEATLYGKRGVKHSLLAQYVNAPLRFYGIGQTSIGKYYSNYKSSDFSFGYSYTYPLNLVQNVGLITDIGYVSINDVEETVLHQDVTGYNGGWYIGLGPQYQFDTRDNVNYPTKGHFIQSSFVYYVPKVFKSYSFYHFKVDYRGFKTLFSFVQVAIHLQSTINKGDVPFYKMSALGSRSVMRGVSSKNYYIDNNLWFSEIELRKMVYRGIGMVVFSGIGNTYDSFDSSMFENIKSMYGAGLRIRLLKNEKLNIRLDYAIGPNQDSGIYATVKESF